MQMQDRVCECPCKRKFRVLQSSDQVYASQLCKWAGKNLKPERTAAWKESMQQGNRMFFVEGQAKRKRGRPKKEREE